MSSKQGILRTAAKGVGVLAVFFLSFTIAFYILQLAYELLYWQPHELLAQFINALLGVVLFAIFIALVELLIPYRKYHPMGDLIDALRRISRGDYHVHLDWEMLANTQGRSHTIRSSSWWTALMTWQRT